MRVLEPLASVVTDDGELKRGKVEMDGHTLRVDCATDNSWVSIHDDSLGDPLAYDVLTRDNGMRSEQPTLTLAWRPEHFAWLQSYIDSPPEPLLFIRRPAQGFATTATPEATETTTATPIPVINVEQQARYFFFSIIYLFLGWAMSQSNNTLFWLFGGFLLLTAMRGFYESRMLVKTTCAMLYFKLKKLLRL